MVRYERPVPRATNAVAAFCGDLRDLRDSAGCSPTVDEISQEAKISRSTIYHSLRGVRLPSVPVLKAMVEAWNGDVGEWLKKRSKIFEQR